MPCRVTSLEVITNGQGLYEFTDKVLGTVHACPRKIDGICTLFIRHTSASLLIQENADPSAKRDLESWLTSLVPENNPVFKHTSEGPDDMPAHIKAALTSTSLSIPIHNGILTLGTWQGIYLWEHRAAPHRREVIVSNLWS
jgi:secondary thiamine-phosphate synthase enzyme